MKLPKSVPEHLFKLNPKLWSVPQKDINWKNLDLKNTKIVSGSAFINTDDPYGAMGNPFSVIIGDDVKNYTKKQCEHIAQSTGTPETIFIRNLRPTSLNIYDLLLTVLTPTDKELGACAHGFTGAIETLLEFGLLTLGSEIKIRTTIDTTATIFISEKGIISLEFIKQEERFLRTPHEIINQIFSTQVLPESKTLPILSVGSPKLTIEVSPEIFSEIQKNLKKLVYDTLLAFEDKEHINGIHVFSRNPKSGLPEKAIQVNAYLGRQNAIDPATGVSSASQISADNKVKENQEIQITQYTQKGASAILSVTKKTGNKILVGGIAVLFNYALA